MENFRFYSPTYFVFGKDEENNTGEFVKKFGGSKVLIHYGGGSVIRSGLLDRVKKSLDKEGIKYVELGGVKPNPRSGLVYEGIDICKKEGIDRWEFGYPLFLHYIVVFDKEEGELVLIKNNLFK
jgi:alcohol dehydrogenase YqhD (iron-dependent ADH family)